MAAGFTKLIRQWICIHYLLVPCITFCQPLPPFSDTATVASVNGEAIATGEFMLIARQKRAKVIRHFAELYQCTYSAGFWEKQFDGHTPAAHLKQATLDTITFIKIQQLTAKQNGLIDDITYAGFHKKLNDENLRRKNAVAQKKVIYGPVQYSEVVYFNYLFSNLVISLKQKLDEKIFRISAEKLRAQYEKDKDSLYRKGYVTNALVLRATPIEVNSREREDWQAKVKLQWNEIAGRSGVGVREFESCSRLAKSDEPYILGIEQLVVNDSVHAPEEEDVFVTMMKEKAVELKPGQTSQAFQYRQALCVVLVTGRTSLGYRSFEACREIVRSKLLDELYLDYIADLAKKAIVRINENNYSAIRF